MSFSLNTEQVLLYEENIFKNRNMPINGNSMQKGFPSKFDTLDFKFRYHLRAAATNGACVTQETYTSVPLDTHRYTWFMKYSRVQDVERSDVRLITCHSQSFNQSFPIISFNVVRSEIGNNFSSTRYRI